MQPSFLLLITTLRAGFDTQAKQRLSSVIRQASENDWQDFLELSDHHNVSNLARSSFRRNELWDLLPEFVRRTLENRYHNTIAWSLKLSHALEQVLPAFGDAGIPLIPWKGPLLSQLLFDNIWDREYVDLDLLMPPQYLSGAEGVLQELGYDLDESEFLETPASLANNNDHCLSWRHQGNQVLLEIHSKPFPGSFRFTPTIDDFLTRCSASSFRSIAFRQLSPEDEFILLVSHGAKHHWSQLNWLCDFTSFIRRYDQSLDWQGIANLAEQNGIARAIKTALFLSEDLFQVTPPEHSFNHPTTDYTACRLAANYASQLQEDYSSSPQKRIRWKYRRFAGSLVSRERYRDRLPVIFSALAYLFTPNGSDRELCPRSFPLSLCAWVVRPFRLICKYALRPFKKNSTLS